ncbi:MAG: hypothetical protein WC702_00970 [Patescibacteria group bacterium]|jgi:hypothetical protein
MSALETMHLESHEEKPTINTEGYFSEINQVDAITVGKGEMKHLGLAVLPLAVAPREIVKALILTEKIKTFKEQSADLELENEEDNAQTYTAYFAATYTDKENKNNYSFCVKISKVTGEIDVIGI